MAPTFAHATASPCAPPEGGPSHRLTRLRQMASQATTKTNARRYRGCGKQRRATCPSAVCAVSTFFPGGHEDGEEEKRGLPGNRGVAEGESLPGGHWACKMQALAQTQKRAARGIRRADKRVTKGRLIARDGRLQGREGDENLYERFNRRRHSRQDK